MITQILFTMFFEDTTLCFFSIVIETICLTRSSSLMFHNFLSNGIYHGYIVLSSVLCRLYDHFWHYSECIKYGTHFNQRLSNLEGIFFISILSQVVGLLFKFQSLLHAIKCDKRFRIYTPISKNRCSGTYRTTKSQTCDLIHRKPVWYKSTKDILNKLWRKIPV